jgi:hypothetical protein
MLKLVALGHGLGQDSIVKHSSSGLGHGLGQGSIVKL